MHGLSTMTAQDNKEIVIAHDRAKKEGDEKLAENIRWAHPGLVKTGLLKA